MRQCPKDPLTGDKLYHPGQHGVPAITLGGSGTITNNTLSPRFGLHLCVQSGSVFRFSYGRYTQPTPTADEQVLTYPDGYQMATNLYDSSYYNNGFASIVHNNPVQFSNNFDASFEQRLKGTDWSYKISPYYRYTSNQSVSVRFRVASPARSTPERRRRKAWKSRSKKATHRATASPASSRTRIRIRSSNTH